MGRGDNRLTRKVIRRRAQRKKQAAEKRKISGGKSEK